MTTRQAPRGGGWKGSQGKGGPGRGGFGKGGFGKGGPGRRFGDEARDEREDLTVLYGWHPVSEALRNPKREFRRLLATENGALRLAEEVGELRITPEIVKPGAITGLLGPDAVHQGLYLEAEPLAGPAFDALPDDAVLLALDQITDPHNVGAIVRTAAAFGVTAIVTTARHSPTVTGVLAKSASGGLEHVPFVVVRNLAEALIELGERGFTRVGLDSDAPETLDAVGPKTPLVVVLGAEGKGLRQRTRECCDVMARIPFRGAIQSLNVSNAAAITLYALMPRA
ncbi:23S rRNA (guanosine2251-2'-O)-methyltransferase [Methylobacterium sp. 174MFSha1.1]|uniref:23S rRNA (guanosine(2251)-2'-O)-methyltransferase RlmB n=1 Tax=Methylobacterium sp. 174MFSha1.1 TaxID=1502749 RepID=UPI0008EF0ADC|nr:23S rRNA (guanosine(2251)-2'-O)-methyltransferase RlmB [Methylobacterium sp. 174MFSha1.1]SFV06826.1 23S rRNA (guanosine2251-2'-O)-methyltransferase [Methylobacterium sp. 174MFSha1.1]